MESIPFQVLTAAFALSSAILFAFEIIYPLDKIAKAFFQLTQAALNVFYALA